MTHGIDTDFLVASEISDHVFHKQADALLQSLLDEGHDFGLTPQSLAEFIHVVTDSKRMRNPLTMTEAISRAELWWQSAEVTRLFPEGQSVTGWLEWLRQFQLGRKRLLDTLLAATYRASGIKRIITNNTKDFRLFGEFEIIGYQ